MTKEDIEFRKALLLMPKWVKEKARRYRKQRTIAEKVFGPFVKRLKFNP